MRKGGKSGFESQEVEESGGRTLKDQRDRVCRE
jgi:hypothetical protein